MPRKKAKYHDFFSSIPYRRTYLSLPSFHISSSTAVVLHELVAKRPLASLSSNKTPEFCHVLLECSRLTRRLCNTDKHYKGRCFSSLSLSLLSLVITARRASPAHAQRLTTSTMTDWKRLLSRAKALLMHIVLRIRLDFSRLS